MAEFPRLKTGAVMQYPASQELTFSNHVVEFMDGREQRYRDSEGVLRRWLIRLELLDDSELAAIEAFFESQQGRNGSFTFHDPMDGTQYANCSLDGDAFELLLEGELRGATSFIVRENRSHP